MSVTAARIGRPQPSASSAHAVARPLGVLRRLHERPAARLHVEQDQVGADRELLRHHARRDQRDRRHRRRRVPERVEVAVRRNDVRCLRRDGAPHLAPPAVRTPRAPDPSAARGSPRACRGSHRCGRAPGRRAWPRRSRAPRRSARRRASRRRRRPRSSACPPSDARSAERQRRSRVHHRARHGERLRVVEPVDEGGHQERRGQLVAHLALGVGEDESADVASGSRARPSRFAATTSRGSASFTDPSSDGEARTLEVPRHARAARRPSPPRSANVPRVPTSCGPPVSPAASSGVRSREWSVDGVVGSQPWSPVRNRTPPSSAPIELGHAAVERLDRVRVSRRIVAVAVLAVEVHEVREHERRRRAAAGTRSSGPRRGRSSPSTGPRSAPAARRCPGSSRPRRRRPRLDAPVEQRRPGRRDREVPALGPPDERAGLAVERPRDHAADVVRSRRAAAARAAPLVERRQGHDVRVGRDLEHRVAARVDDRPARPKVLLPELAR